MGEKKTRKVLAIDDSRADISLLKSHLRKMGLTVLSAEDALAGIEIAFNKQPDVILLDVMMPGIDGFEACKRLKADTRTTAIPVIFVSGKEQSCDKIAGLDLGAIDYITKPYDPGELRARIESVIRTLELQEELFSLAVTDELTGLANRRRFFDVLEGEILKARMEGTCLSLMMLDSDHFKKVNDTYGHLAGDDVLRQIGRILRENVYPLDTPARYGGEEFAVIMPKTTYSQVTQAAERLRRKIDQWQWKIDENLISITVSIGVAYNKSYDMRELVNHADQALYMAKKEGRNQTVCWDQIDTSQRLQSSQTDEYHELQLKINSLAADLRSQFLETISAFLKTMEVKDPYIALHSKNVQVYATAIADQMDISDELKQRLESAALLHDIGKVGIPDEILQKTDPLTDDDKQIIEDHVIAGTDILKPIGMFSEELPIIRQHHERFNGAGYPNGLEGKAICIGARIMAVADVFDAITSKRPYRSALPLEEAIREITDRGQSQFDPEVVEAFKAACRKHGQQWPLSGDSVRETSDQESLAIKV